MIIASNVGPGTYTFDWDGGSSFVSVSATTPDSGAVQISYIDDFSAVCNVGNSITLNGSPNYTTFSAPAGSYKAVISGTPSGVNVVIHHLPG